MSINENEIVFTMIFTTLIILLLVAGIVISIFMYRKQLLHQQIQIQQQELTFQKELREAENAMGETVMAHVSRELHDNIGQLLTLMNLQMETQKLDNPSSESTLTPIQQTLAEAHQQMRSLSRSLNTDYVTSAGFISSLQLELERLKKLKRMNIHWNYNDQPPALSKEQQLMAFRIFQEIVSNAVKYSEAKNLSVSVNGGNDFRMLISDDGRGFNAKQVMRSAVSNGLHNVMRRAELSGMDCVIESEEGKGCRYILMKRTG